MKDHDDSTLRPPPLRQQHWQGHTSLDEDPHMQWKVENANEQPDHRHTTKGPTSVLVQSLFEVLQCGYIQNLFLTNSPDNVLYVQVKNSVSTHQKDDSQL
jgi:hypothetical protein